MNALQFRRIASSVVSSLASIAVVACIASGSDVAVAQRMVPAGQQRLVPAGQLEGHRRLNLQFQGEKPQPLSMVSGDFDEDGVNDLVIGYGLQQGGSLAFLRGNLDARAPQTKESWAAAGRHEYSEPYLQTLRPIQVKVRPNVMISADVNGDGHLDMVYGTLGNSQLNVMLGDGKGNFLAPITTTVAGAITALAAYRPGQPMMGEAIVAGYQSRAGNALAILAYSSGGLVQRAAYHLSNPAVAMTVANLDSDLIPDIAIVSGGKLLILHGKNALGGRGSMTTVPIADVESVTAGEFLFDRHTQLQLSVMTTDGDVVTMAHEGFDPRPYTPEQIAETRRGQHGHSSATEQTLAEQAGNTGNEPWIEVERSSGVAVHGLGGRLPILLHGRVSGSGGDDLIVMNSSGQEKTVIGHAPISARTAFVPSSQPSRIVSSGLGSGDLGSDDVVAAVAASVSPDARQGLVVLRANDFSPDITLPSAGNTFYVNTTADNTGTSTDPSDGIRCTLGSGEICTLRDAITFINNDASDNISAGKSDTIMVPGGTYNLTWQAGTTDANTNALTHLEILGPVTIIGSASSPQTIINAGNNDTILTINPGPFGSFNPSGNSYVFDTTLENLVLENGKNVNNLNINGLANFVGGGLNWDASGTGNLTLTNTIVENNVVLWGPGGGIWAENSVGGGTGTLTITGGSISNNSTPELGGGIDEAFPPTGLSVTNTTFTGNKAQISVNSSDGDADGSGGGLFLEGRQPPPATPRSTLTNVTLTSNVAANDNGGGIATFGGIILSGSVLSNNSTGGSGGGIWSNPSGDGSQTTITSTNFLSNTASSTGGAIAMGIETQAEGNILQVSLSRIFGNTATGGASGLANGASGQGAGQAIATENWWGCNTGPTTASDGCDQATLFNGAGSLTTAPFAKLGFSADVTTIPPGGSANLTVSLNTDSNNNSITGAFPAVATNYPYTYNVTGVTVSPALTTGTFNTSGVGTAVLTPTTGGNGSVTATFDGQTDTINFTAQSAAGTSLAITATPSASYSYGQPSGFTVQLTPSNATGITTSDFQVLVDGSATLGGSPFGLTLISNNDYTITGPFNLLSATTHTLAVNFLGTTNFATSNTSIGLTVSLGTVTIGHTVTPPNPVRGQGGTVDVTVTGVGSGTAATGTITYAFDGGTSHTVSLVGGAVSIAVPTLATGNHTVSVTYNGDANYASASTSVPLTIFGASQTTIASITTTTAQINVFGFGFTPPSGQLTFTDTTSGTPVAGPVTLNAGTATTSLLPQVTTSTGVNSLPVWTELGDLNGDGNLDLITSVFGTDSVNIQLGNGDGTFGAATSILIAAGFGPAEVHAVSLRGNGALDLIAASFNTNQIAVMLGNGNGTFQPPAFYTVGTALNTPTSLTTGDFNHDGSLDVAIANTGDNTVSILLGNGSGVLTPLGAPINVGRDPEAIRAGDFNGDGFTDLAVANYRDGNVTILLNNQDETFTASTVTVGTGPQALAITGTGANLLLAVANFTTNNVSILKNDGNGTFTAQTPVNVGNGPDEVEFTDINGDGIPDLVVTNYTDSSLTLATGSAGGTYTALTPFPIGNNPYAAAVGDLNGDGTPDIVVANCFSNNVGTLLSGTQISVPYTGLALVPGDTLHAVYTPDGSSKYGSSTSANVTAP